MFEHKNVQNGTILRDVFIFKFDNIRNEAILRDSSFFEVQDIKNEEFCETSGHTKCVHLSRKIILANLHI